MSDKPDVKVYLCKYQVPTLVVMKGGEKIIFDHSNILSIEYSNDYEFNVRAVLKISLRLDVRKRLWILKNKKDVKAKFELTKVGIDVDVEKFVTTPQSIWNSEFGVYFNDDDESTDIKILEERIKINEGEDFQSNDITNENYFESQNTLDIYLFHPKLLAASNFPLNEVITKNTMQQIVSALLTKSKHINVLMSKMENDEIYEELLVPANPAFKSLIYLDQYYGFYKKGAVIYYDVDTLYILNSNGKLTAKRKNEWTETTILVTKIDSSVPGNGMLRKEGEKIFYVTIPEMSVNPQKFSIAKNAEIGSEAKIVVTDDTTIDLVDAEQSYIDQRNQQVVYTKKDNKYATDTIKARMEENECVLYISGENLDINAFTPNKVFQIIFDEPLKHKRYGKNKYRLAYAYHFLKLESETYMSSSHQIVLKKVEGPVS